ncbi:hypothetical protein Clacol_003464 [Clathrus columnatus]|uniref:F-box protein n=1 Tax=Clathrus columnatus TaxID=1419009 RepID=A0AAV5A3Q9_9AGAM|nr:hypothetical protein Clacol_003464 [Clathrus columnatus]
MPAPDALPLEIWYRIIKLGKFSDRDSRPMLAVAPRTARNMHDAAFSTIFQSLYIGFSEGTDPNKLASKLSSYLDSLPLRSTTRYLRVDISTERWVDADGPDPWIESQIKVHLPPKLEDLICDVLSALPNITELNCRYEFESPLDLRTANTLQYLSLEHCQFYHPEDGPSIISDAKIQTLTLHIEDVGSDNSPRGPRQAPTRPTNIFSRLNLSSLATLYLRLHFPSQQDLSYLLTGSLSNDSPGLGVNLQSLLLCDIGVNVAIALSNACYFPSLRLCYLECPTHHGTRHFVRPLCLFLKRQVSLERLECKFSQYDMPSYEAVQCVEDVVNILYCLKDLKYLKLTGCAFSLGHPVLRMAPLPQLQVLSIRSTTTAPLTEIAGTLVEKLQSYPSLRSFLWHVLMNTTIGSDHERRNFVKTLKDTSRIEFVQVASTTFWLRNEDGPEPRRILSGKPDQGYEDLEEMYRYRTYWGDYLFCY